MERAQTASIILVLGMHRSGTSALAGVLNHLGAEMPGELMPPAAGNNEKGFFESQALFRFHEDLLREAGSAWDDILPMPEGYFASPAGLARRDDLTELLARDYAGRPLTAVKDPRICRLMPLWRPAMAAAGLAPLVVLPLRNPIEVALSLQRRNGFDLSKGLLLWLRHVLSAEHETRDMKRAVTTYEGLLADWRRTLDAVSETLGVVFPRDPTQMLPTISAFLDHELRHNVGSDDLDRRSDVPSEVKEAWSALNRLGPAGDEADIRAVLGRLDERLADASRLFGGYAGWTRRSLRQSEERLHVAAIDRDRSQEQLATAHAEVDRLARERDIAQAERLRAAQDLAALKGSTIWRWTSPLRRIVDQLRQPQTATGLPEHAREGAASQSYATSVLDGDDESYDVPISGPAVDGENPSVCVVAHVFYPELLPELLAALDHIPDGFDLYVSTPAAVKEDVEAALSGWRRGRVVVQAVQNRGRDISHKLITFGDVYERYEYVLFVHTKKSLHDPVLVPWRSFLLANLVGSADIARTHLALLNANPWLGMIASQHFGPIRPWVGWGHAYAAAERLAARMGIRLSRDALLDFPSGSMFWARTAALKPLLGLDLSFEDFEEESGQAGDTLAHAIERLFFHACETAGFGWIKVARPELLAGLPSLARRGITSDLGAFRLPRPVRSVLSPDPNAADAGPPAELVAAAQDGLPITPAATMNKAPVGEAERQAAHDLAGATAARVEAAVLRELRASQEALTIALVQERQAARALISDIDALKHSTSWRLTAPLRGLGTLMGRHTRR